MGRMTLKAWVNETKEHVVLQMDEDDKPLAHMMLEAADLEKTIHDLGRHRAALNEPVTPDLDPGSRLEAVVDPVWRGPAEKLKEGRLLAFRHPGLGWISFVIPEHEVGALVTYLQADFPTAE